MGGENGAIGESLRMLVDWSSCSICSLIAESVISDKLTVCDT